MRKSLVYLYVCDLVQSYEAKDRRMKQVGSTDGYLASEARLETQIWYRLEESRSKSALTVVVETGSFASLTYTITSSES